MSNAKIRAIETRMQSIQNTQKMTKAMGLVASSQLEKAKIQVEKSRPYFEILHDTLIDIVQRTSTLSSPYIEERTTKRPCIIVIGGDRGLAGGYNSNIIKKVKQILTEQETWFVPIGKKTLASCQKIGCNIWTKSYNSVAEMSISQCFDIGRNLCNAFLAGTFDEITLVFTEFISMIEQTTNVLTVLPLSHKKKNEHLTFREHFLYEPNSESVYDSIVPEYVAGLLYGALCEARASELAARHTAMDSASRNADDILKKLDLEYNHARQGAITQEITEIVAGSKEL